MNDINENTFRNTLYERTSEIIGEGAFSIVYKGYHKMTRNPVAIKVYKSVPKAEEASMQTRFQHTVKCFDRIMHGVGTAGLTRNPLSSSVMSEVSSVTSRAQHNPLVDTTGGLKSPTIVSDEVSNDQQQPSVRNESMFSQPLSFRSNWEMSRMMRMTVITRELVVSLLDYSKLPDGRPGKENGEFYVVMELGDYSLEEYISYRDSIKSPFSVDEVRSILWDITRVVCLLHAQGLAHLDIKPGNIMLFNSTFWKLIDFDGCFNASSVVDMMQSDVAFTPLYCAPEIAGSIVRMADDFRVSRLMDVWSIGQIAAELVYMHPLLEQKFSQLYRNEDDSHFLQWLANPDTTIDISRVHEFDLDLFDLLHNHILIKMVKKRSSLPDILQHRFFTCAPIKKKTWFKDRLKSATIPEGISRKQGRILPINPRDIHVDLNQPLEDDDKAAFMHDGSIDEDDDGHVNNDAISEISPSPRQSRSRSLLQILACRCN